MKIRLTVILLTFLQFQCFSQQTYTSRKGSKFFPNHFDIVITVDNNKVRYELFNHWYSFSYDEYRQITISLDSLSAFNQKNDTIKIELQKRKVKLVDKKYRLARKIKHRDLCVSAPIMRKISFACNLTRENSNIKHFELYNRDDLKLEEEEFKRIVLENLKQKIK